MQGEYRVEQVLHVIFVIYGEGWALGMASFKLQRKEMKTATEREHRIERAGRVTAERETVEHARGEVQQSRRFSRVIDAYGFLREAFSNAASIVRAGRTSSAWMA